MRALRVVLALLLAAGSVQAQPVVDLLTRYAVPTDQTASSAPEGDAPPGSGKKLAELEAYLALVSEGLEAFAHPQDAEKALRAAKPRLPDGTSPFFRDRATALDTLYRTLAVVDYSWALRFPDPPCSPAAKRARLLRSDDGLFLDPISGKTSSWMAALLGPTAKDKSLEASLDQASISAAPSQAEYARLRARQNLITKALDSEDAVGEARAKLYCKRAEVREKLASSNRASGPVLAPRSSGEGNSRRGVVIMAGRTADDLEIRGAGVVVETKSGIRVLTDRRLGAGTVVALVDGNHQPVPLSIEREDEKSGLMLLRPDGDVGEAMAIGEAAPKKDDLVFAFAHSDRLGAWTRTQGLVTSADVGQFQTDAVADASMTGGAILDEAGVLAGVLVLRRAGDGGGEWPAAVPAPALRAWIDGGDAPEASPAPISDAGTTKILTASRPLLESVSVGQGAISASADSFTQRTPWGSTTRAVCVANCGDSSPGASYSGGGNGNAELGQALGKLAVIGVQALIFKGIPALFRGIGSLFKSNPSKGEIRKESANSNHETKRKEPEKLPDPILKFDLTTKRLDDSIIFSARVTANRKDVRLNNIAVGFTVNGSTQPLVRTDDDGLAVLKVYTPRSIAAHESLDEESAKHPWLTNASRIVTKQNLCIVTLFGATAAVGVVLVAPAPIALVTTTGVALAANPPATVSSCVIIAKVTSLAAAAACTAMVGEEMSNGALHAPQAVPPAPPRTPPPLPLQNERDRPKTIGQRGFDRVRSNAESSHEDLENYDPERTPDGASNREDDLTGPADPGGEPPENESLESNNSRGNLNEAQQRKLEEFKKKLPRSARKIEVRNLPNGGKAFQADVPARNIPGSYARYEKQLDALGNTTSFTKTTYGADGRIIHVRVTDGLEKRLFFPEP